MTLESLAARVETLERQNRRMRAGGVLLLVLSCGLAALGQAAPGDKVVRAERFEVLASGGESCAVLGLLPDGSQGLALSDRDGKKVRASLSVLPDGSPRVAFFDKDSKARATFGVLPDGAPQVALFDLDRKGRASLIVLPDGSAMLLLNDKDGKSRAALATAPDGSPALALFDKDGKVLFRAPQ